MLKSLLGRFTRANTVAIPDDLWRAAMAALPCAADLTTGEAARLRDLAGQLLAEKEMSTAGDLELTADMQVNIAVQACLPILNLGLEWYRGWSSIVVYPGEFLVRGREHEDEFGIVHQGDDVLSGESWENGPVILAWQDVLASGQGQAFDVVAHEFAHKLDFTDGAMNGLPALHRGMPVEAWIAAFQTAFDHLIECLDRGEETWLDPYAAEDPSEFFAVCTEMFFDVPEELDAEYPAVFAQLAAFFRQDPRASGRA